MNAIFYNKNLLWDIQDKPDIVRPQAQKDFLIF